MSIPRVLSLFVFRSAVQGGSGYSESIQYLRSSLPPQVPWILLPSLYQAEIMDDSLFPSHTWQRTEKNRGKTREKKLFNYFKQHTKLKHCAELSKGQHPEHCGFPAVWGEGNTKGISAELSVKREREGERERERERGGRNRENKYTLEYRLPNELKGLASSDGFKARTPL